MTYQTDGATSYLEEVSSDFASLPLTMFIRSRCTGVTTGQTLTLAGFANAVDGSQCILRTSGSSIAQARQQNATGTGTNAGITQLMNSWGTLVLRFTSNSSRDIFDSAGKTTGTTAITGMTAMDRFLIGVGANTSGAKANYCNVAVNIAAIWNVALDDSECLSLTGGLAVPLQVRPQSLIRLYNLENLNDYIKGATLTNVNGATLFNTDVGRKKYPRRTKQALY